LKKNLKKRNEKKRKKRKKKKVEKKRKKNKKKVKKKKRKITVDYCCNPQWFVCGGTVNPSHVLVY